MNLVDRYRVVVDKIATACQKSGRKSEDVELLAVSKFQPVSAIVDLAKLGQTNFGENYVQEALAKRTALVEDFQNINLRWDLIGHVQTRKVPLVAGKFNLIHTIDSLKLVQALEKNLALANLKQDILIEVNIGSEPQKTGIMPDKVENLTRQIIDETPHLNLRGLMCMPPLIAGGEKARPYFQSLRLQRDKLELALGESLPILSMGMSEDFPIAIEEGATIVRIGTAIFGPRPTQ